MHTLIFTPDRNTAGRKDYTGAFRPEAHALAKLHDGSKIVAIDVSQPPRARRQEVMNAIVTFAATNLQRIDLIAFFCHGWRAGLQLGWTLQTLPMLAGAIWAVSGDAPRVALYACSAARGGAGGDGGVADRLRDALCERGASGCQVDAHTTKGHCSRNPYVRRFEGQGSPVGGTGGQWIVMPLAPLWRPWVRALRGPLRLRYPTMATAEIHRELVGDA